MTGCEHRFVPTQKTSSTEYIRFVGVRLVVLAVVTQSGQVATVRSFRVARILPALLLAPSFLFESVPLVLR